MQDTKSSHSTVPIRSALRRSSLATGVGRSGPPTIVERMPLAETRSAACRLLGPVDQPLGDPKCVIETAWIYREAARNEVLEELFGFRGALDEECDKPGVLGGDSIKLEAVVNVAGR